MKLYLSSNRFGANPSLLREVASGSRVDLIVNSLDGYSKSRPRETKRNAEELEELGFQVEELDLRHYFGDPEGLTKRLGDTHLLWVTGGNTFSLARAMIQSQFKEALMGPLSDGRLVYGGYSAGACVTGPDLQGCHLMDEQASMPLGYPAGYASDIAAVPLQLVSWRTVPHWHSDHEEAELADDAVNYLTAEGLEFRAISDGQVIIVNDEEVSVI